MAKALAAGQIIQMLYPKIADWTTPGVWYREQAGFRVAVELYPWNEVVHPGHPPKRLWGYHVALYIRQSPPRQGGGMCEIIMVQASIDGDRNKWPVGEPQIDFSQKVFWIRPPAGNRDGGRIFRRGLGWLSMIGDLQREPG